MSPAKGNLKKMQTIIKKFYWTMFKTKKITSFAVVSLAVGGFGKVNRQDEKEKNLTNHLQQTDLARTMSIEVHRCYKGDNF